MEIGLLADVQHDAAIALWHAAGAVMDACERWLADRGAPKLNLMVRVGREPILGFYEALGHGRVEVVVMSRRLG